MEDAFQVAAEEFERAAQHLQIAAQGRAANAQALTRQRAVFHAAKSTP